jgi:protein phosphatase
MRIRIGDFARMSQMSVKPLRYYDRMGLFKPVEIDRFTGYRYYNEAQLKPARLVLILRRLDMPLALIQHLHGQYQTCAGATGDQHPPNSVYPGAGRHH